MSSDATTIVIASAARTPVGSFNGALASLPAHELGRVAIRAALERASMPFAPSLSTWAEQAGFLARGDEEGFKALTDRLVAGVAPETEEPVGSA